MRAFCHTSATSQLLLSTEVKISPAVSISDADDFERSVGHAVLRALNQIMPNMMNIIPMPEPGPLVPSDITRGARQSTPATSHNVPTNLLERGMGFDLVHIGFPSVQLDTGGIDT